MAKKKNQTSDDFYNRKRQLCDEIYDRLREVIGNKKINLENQDAAFEDEANNRVVKVDKNLVYFDGAMETYPLHELGINDAIYILSVIED